MGKKELIVKKSRAEQLLEILNANQDNDIHIASKSTDNWRYIDFVNPVLNTPCLALEYLFGSRGAVLGRLMKLEAPFGVGKSSFMFYMYGCAQRCCNAFTYHMETEAAEPPPDFIASFGADPTDLMVELPKSVERCLERIDTFICSVRGGFGGTIGETGKASKTKFVNALDKDKQAPIVIGIDSISGLGLNDTVDLDVMDATKTAAIGKHARILSKFFQERTTRLKDTDTLLMMAAQVKAKISTGYTPPGQKTTATIADTAIGYHATWVLEMSSSKYDDDVEGSPTFGKNIGEKITIKTTKNKVSDKAKQITLYLVRNKGFDLVKTDAKFLISDDGSPFTGADDMPKRYGGGVIFKPLSEKRFESEAEFLKALYADTGMVLALREKMRIRGFGFPFETDYLKKIEQAEEVTNVVEGSTTAVP